MALCQRYYQSSKSGGGTPTANDISVGYGVSLLSLTFKVTMRSAPTMLTYNDTGSGTGYYTVASVNNYTDGTNLTVSPDFFVMRIPSSNAIYQTRTGYSATSEL